MALSKIRNDSLVDTAVHGRRNLIINGAMQVAQRGTSFDKNSYTGTGFYSLDRFQVQGSLPSVDLTIEQSTDAPSSTHFRNSLKVTVDSGASTYPASASQYIRIRHLLEAQNVTHLQGTKCTLSFWVKSSVAGGYDVALYAQDVSGNDHQVLPYDVNTANTWEYKTLTFTGPSTINNDTGLGLDVQFQLAKAGTTYQTSSTNVWGGVKLSSSDSTDALIKTDGATFQITGVQLEVGDIATPFEHRSYGEELSLCHRYFQKDIRCVAWNLGSGDTTSACNASYHTPMRATPSLTRTANGGLTSTAPTNAYPYLTSMLIYSSSSNACSGLYDVNAEL